MRRCLAFTTLVFGLWLCAAVVTGSVFAEDLVVPIGEGSVNWTKGTIQGKGIGAPPEKYYGKPNARPMAIRAAKIVALRNILETVNGVRIDSETIVKDFALDSDVIRSQVEGYVRGAKQKDIKYLSDGTVEVIMEIRMFGEFSEILLPPAIQPEPTAMDTGTAPADGSYSGLVVDARGLGVRPAMAPKIIDENGEEVYGSAFVSREYAVQQGMTGYAKDVGSAKSNDRVTANPFVIKAKRADGPGKCDLVVSNADASMLRGAADTRGFLEKCRVMIVVD